LPPPTFCTCAPVLFFPTPYRSLRHFSSPSRRSKLFYEGFLDCFSFHFLFIELCCPPCRFFPCTAPPPETRTYRFPRCKSVLRLSSTCCFRPFLKFQKSPEVTDTSFTRPPLLALYPPPRFLSFLFFFLQSMPLSSGNFKYTTPGGGGFFSLLLWFSFPSSFCLQIFLFSRGDSCLRWQRRVPQRVASSALIFGAFSIPPLGSNLVVERDFLQQGLAWPHLFPPFVSRVPYFGPPLN